MTKRGLLLIGHGSRTGDSAAVLRKTATLMMEKTNCRIFPAFLEFDLPSVTDAINAVKRTDVEEVVAVPMLLARGTHTEKTIPELLGMAPGKKEGELLFDDGRIVQIRCADPIGADTVLVDILLSRAEAVTFRS